MRDAANALKAYVDRFPKHDGVEEGQKLLEDTRKRLMAHERYVADFYRANDKPRAYVGRLEIIRRRFADVGLTDELLLEIVETYAELGEVDKAKDAARDIEKQFPDSKRLAKAMKLVEAAKKAAPPPPPPEPAPDEPEPEADTPEPEADTPEPEADTPEPGE